MSGALPVIGLDDDEALRTGVAGAKAAALARARRRGLPVLPGLVVPAACALPFLEAAVSVYHAEGQHAARLAVMSEVTAAGTRFGQLAERAAALGSVLVVRSSSRSEDDPRWAGAYSSVLDVRPGDLVAAIASCWSSALGEDAMFRREAAGATLAETCPAVLIQPFVLPRLAGTATSAAGEPVAVVVARGSPAPLLAGHVPGLTATVAGSAVHGAALELAGPATFREVAAVARAAGDGNAVTVEWALADERLVLLQVRPAATPHATTSAQQPTGPAALRRPGSAPPPHGGADGRPPPRAAAGEAQTAGPLAQLAGLVARYAGPLGEQAVLPWLVAYALRGTVPEPGDPRAGPVAVGDSGDPRADFEAALRLVPRVLAEAWRVPEGPAAGHATAVMALLAHGDVDRVLAEIAQPGTAVRAETGAAAARALLGLLAGVGAALARRGALANAGQIWGLRPEQVRALLAVPAPPARAAPVPFGWHGLRRRMLRWQPFLQSTAARFGTAVRAEPASPGAAAGLARRISRPEDIRALVPGEVAVVGHAHPRFAPVLWTAGALVAEAGSPAAHLMEVARSLRVPALCAAPGLPAMDGRGCLLCVDGDNGVLTMMNTAGQNGSC